MKAIILAAGKGTRLEPITLEIPKAMVQVHGKTLLEHNMERLLPYVNEFIIVVKYKAEVIKKYFGNEYKGVSIRYHEQGEEKGTGAAIKGIHVSGDLIIAYADAIIASEDIDNIMKQKGNAVFVKEVSNPEKYGIFKSDKDGYALEVIEKPKKYIGNLANFSFFKVNDSILEYIQQVTLSPRGEIEITDAINLFIQDHLLKLVHLKNDIIDITSPEDLEKANVLKKPKLGDTLFLENIGDYQLHLGFPKTGLSQIIEYSQDMNDIALQKGTGDKKRFPNIEKLSSWYNDTNRYPFSLLSEFGDIAGIWWGRPTKAPEITQILDQKIYDVLHSSLESIHTSGIRIYPFARGKRLAGIFLAACTKHYDSLFESVHMCIDIDEENIPSQKAFEKAGFRKVGYGQNDNTSKENSFQFKYTKRFVYLKTPE